MRLGRSTGTRPRASGMAHSICATGHAAEAEQAVDLALAADGAGEADAPGGSAAMQASRPYTRSGIAAPLRHTAFNRALDPAPPGQSRESFGAACASEHGPDLDPALPLARIKQS